MDISAKIEKYIKMGFSERHDFPDEYVLLVHRGQMCFLRIYLDGRVWKKTMKDPNYVLVEE